MSNAVNGENASNSYREAEAKYQRYIAFPKRYESFVGWPNNNVLQSAKNMALAGFFYIGSSDRARCFYCGLTLRDWDEDDEPFSVHKQWSPKCGYISHIAEQRLSSGIQSLHVTDSHGSRSAVTSNYTTTSQIATDSASPSSIQGQSTLTARVESSPISGLPQANTMFSATRGAEMDHQMSEPGTVERETVPTRTWEHPPHIQAVLEMGYTMEDIRKAADERRLAGEEDFADAFSLLRAVEGWT